MSDLLKTIKALSAASQKLRVAVTKTSQQGEDAQVATPNLMSFSTNENSIWFNGNRYGVWHVNNLKTCTNNSTNEELVKILGPATDAHLKSICDFILRGGVGYTQYDYSFYPVIFESHYDTKSVNIKIILWSAGYLNYMNYQFRLTDRWTCITHHETISHVANIDKYISALGTSIQMPNAVGGISAGTTVATLNGKTQNQIIDMLLFPEQQPQVVAPSATILLSSGFINNEIMEVGMAAPVASTNIRTAFNQGYGRVAGQPDKKRAGALNSEASFIYYGGQESNKTLPTKVVLGTMQYNYHAAYAQGEQLVTSWGNKASVQPNPLPAGTVNSAAVYIYGTYPYFANGADASTSNGDGNMPSVPVPNNKLKLYKWTDTLIGAKFASEASSGTRLEFKFPSTKNVTKVEFYNTVSGKWEVFASANYAISDAGNIQVQGAPVAYKKLTTQGAMSGALQLRFTVANAARSESDEPDTYNGEPITDEVFRMLASNSTTLPFVEERTAILAAAEARTRPAGVAAFAVNFEPGGQAPLDARTVVGTKADLINADTYAAKNYYQGMLVIVKDTQEVYVLKDIAKITSADYSGWKRVDGGGGVTQVVVENVLTSTSTTHALSAAQGKVLNDNKVAKSEIVDDTSTDDATKPLSARQGKSLQDEITVLENNIQDLQTSIPTKTSQLTNDSNYVTTNNVLTKTNTTVYNPTDNYHPATKKYVDDKVAAGSGGNSNFVDFDFNKVNALTSQSTAQEVKAAFAGYERLKTDSIIRLTDVNETGDWFDSGSGHVEAFYTNVDGAAFSFSYIDKFENQFVEITANGENGNIELWRINIVQDIPTNLVKCKIINVANGSLLTINKQLFNIEAEQHISKIFGSSNIITEIVKDICENNTKYYIHNYNDKYNTIELSAVYAYWNKQDEYNLQFNISYYTNNGPVSKRIGMKLDTSDATMDELFIEDILVSDNLQRVVKRSASEYESTTPKDASTMYGVTE